MRQRAHKYVATSERAFPDEIENVWYSDREYKVGDTFEDADGLVWHIVMVIY